MCAFGMQVVRCGPNWVTACWASERYCGFLCKMANCKSYPETSIFTAASHLHAIVMWALHHGTDFSRSLAGMEGMELDADSQFLQPETFNQPQLDAPVSSQLSEKKWRYRCSHDEHALMHQALLVVNISYKNAWDDHLEELGVQPASLRTPADWRPHILSPLWTEYCLPHAIFRCIPV